LQFTPLPRAISPKNKSYQETGCSTDETLPDILQAELTSLMPNPSYDS